MFLNVFLVKGLVRDVPRADVLGDRSRVRSVTPAFSVHGASVATELSSQL